MITFLNALDVPIPKMLFSFSSEFRVLVTSGAWGLVLVAFEPFWSEGGFSQRAVSSVPAHPTHPSIGWFFGKLHASALPPFHGPLVVTVFKSAVAGGCLSADAIKGGPSNVASYSCPTGLGGLVSGACPGTCESGHAGLPRATCSGTTYSYSGECTKIQPSAVNTLLWTTSDGDYEWTKEMSASGTPSGGTGPSKGPDSAPYWYTEASSRYNKLHYLYSPPGFYLGLTFKYHMYGSSMGYLALEIETGGGWVEVWRKTGQQHDSSSAAWTSAEVTFPKNDISTRARFKSVTGNSFRGDAGVADMALVWGTINCDLRTGYTSTTFCGGVWRTDSAVDELWKRRGSGGTPSRNTGPDRGPDNGPYLYVEATSNYDKYSTLMSESGRYTGVYLQYHMYGTDTGDLSIQTQQEGQLTWTEIMGWSGQQHTSHTDPWKEAVLPLSGPVAKVRIVARTGSNNYRSDISIAELRLLPWLATCADGAKDGDEIGIDCGGSCPACTGIWYGNAPAGRAVRDTRNGMHFISEYAIDKAGTVVAWRLETFQSAVLHLEVWRPRGLAYPQQYKKIGSSGERHVSQGETWLKEGSGVMVLPGDVLGWYSPEVQPITYSNGGGRRVRRIYTGLVDVLDMSGHSGWDRQYSIAVSVEINISRDMSCSACVPPSPSPSPSQDLYVPSVGYQCGGSTINPLEDGTPDGWAPGASGVDACKAKCTSAASCSAFIWRTLDIKCFWKARSDASMLEARSGDDCYLKKVDAGPGVAPSLSPSPSASPSPSPDLSPSPSASPSPSPDLSPSPSASPRLSPSPSTIPEAEVTAIQGHVTAPMAVFQTEFISYVAIPNNGAQRRQPSTGPGRVSFAFAATSQTDVQFGFKVAAKTSDDDSFFLQVDSGPVYEWHVAQRSPVFMWVAPNISWAVGPGTHVLTVIAHEDGCKLSRVRLLRGAASFRISTTTVGIAAGQLQPTATVSGSCAGYDSVGAYVCSGVSNRIGMPTSLAGDFTVVSRFRATKKDTTALAFWYELNGVQYFIGLDGTNEQFFHEPPTVMYGASTLSLADQDLTIARSSDTLTAALDGVVFLSLNGRSGTVSSVGWRPHRNTVHVSSLEVTDLETDLGAFVGSGYWTRWFDLDDPSGAADDEALSSVRVNHPDEICTHPRHIQARRVSDKLPANATGQTFVHYNAHLGFLCPNADNGQSCDDYEVRYFCPGTGYEAVAVGKNCSEFGFTVITTEECAQAGVELGWGVDVVAQHSSSQGISAGCFGYTGGTSPRLNSTHMGPSMQQICRTGHGPVDCGIPGRTHWVFSGCNGANRLLGGVCVASCAPGSEGSPTATCTLAGTWAYRGSCTVIRDADYRTTFSMTGCTASNPLLTYWKSLSVPRALHDMFQTCDQVRRGAATVDQRTQCCGSKSSCVSSCTRLSTIQRGPFALVSSGRCTSISEAECAAISGYAGLNTMPNSFTSGCHYVPSEPAVYYNRGPTRDCTSERKCICREAGAYYLGAYGSECLSDAIVGLEMCRSALDSLLLPRTPEEGTGSNGLLPLGCSYSHADARLHFNTGSAGAQGRGDVAPVCPLGGHHLRDSGTECLPAARVTDIESCRAALDALGLPRATTEWTGSAGSLPVGCSYRRSDSMIHFNTAASGRARNDLASVCKLALPVSGWITPSPTWYEDMECLPRDGVNYPHDGAKAFDRDRDTQFRPTGCSRGYNRWTMDWDMGDYYALTRLKLVPEADGAHDTKAFQLHHHDGARWVSIGEFEVPQPETRESVFTFDAVTARRWRINVTKTFTGYEPWLKEIGLFGQKSGAACSPAATFPDFSPSAGAGPELVVTVGTSPFTFAADILISSDAPDNAGIVAALANGWELAVDQDYLNLMVHSCSGYEVSSMLQPQCTSRVPPRGSVGRELTSADPLPRAVWHNVALIRAGAAYHLYINGVHSCTATVDAACDHNIQPMLVGGSSPADVLFHGEIAMPSCAHAQIWPQFTATVAPLSASPEAGAAPTSAQVPMKWCRAPRRA